ncbi:1735_t:CDS:2 [Ambispora leptoticha]|uniref:1735_t:CDS:1 n=1 Tax=Ambispora leptoticha TaxID=144679 RepID=A0A9N9HKP4_9GLOM|nr:1735_t:CDS:2 [Ambispora leptoticha]
MSLTFLLPPSISDFTPEQLSEVLKLRNATVSSTTCQNTLEVLNRYVFELLYRPVMRLPLVMHHLTTIGLVIYGVYILNNAGNLDIVPLGLILLFQASTEQSTFLGLLFYRLKHSWSSVTLFFAAVQVFIVKFATLVWCYTFWGKHLLPNKESNAIITGFNVVFPIGGVILFGTQLWSTYVVLKIAIKARQLGTNKAPNVDLIDDHLEASENKLENGSNSNKT